LLVANLQGAEPRPPGLSPLPLVPTLTLGSAARALLLAKGIPGSPISPVPQAEDRPPALIVSGGR